MAYSKKVRREIFQEYLVGGDPLAEIARKHKMREGTVWKWAREENWPEMRERMQTRAMEKCIEASADKLSKHNEKFLKVWDAFLARVIHRLNVEEKTAIEHEALEALSRIAERAQKGQRVAMNADAPGEEGPQKVIVEYQGLAVSIGGDGGAPAQ